MQDDKEAEQLAQDLHKVVHFSDDQLSSIFDGAEQNLNRLETHFKQHPKNLKGLFKVGPVVTFPGNLEQVYHAGSL